MLTHHALVANVAQVAAGGDIREDEKFIAVLPFFHIYGMQVLMNAGLRIGVTTVTMPRFELEDFLRLGVGIVVAGRLQHAGQHRALGQCQVGRCLSEVLARRREDSVTALPEVAVVEVHLQDLVLGVLLLELVGQVRFLYLPP